MFFWFSNKIERELINQRRKLENDILRLEQEIDTHLNKRVRRQHERLKSILSNENSKSIINIKEHENTRNWDIPYKETYADIIKYTEFTLHVPFPTEKQIMDFVDYVPTAHSWYKRFLHASGYFAVYLQYQNTCTIHDDRLNKYGYLDYTTCTVDSEWLGYKNLPVELRRLATPYISDHDEFKYNLRRSILDMLELTLLLREKIASQNFSNTITLQ